MLGGGPPGRRGWDGLGSEAVLPPASPPSLTRLPAWIALRSKEHPRLPPRLDWALGEETGLGRAGLRTGSSGNLRGPPLCPRPVPSTQQGAEASVELHVACGLLFPQLHLTSERQGQRRVGATVSPASQPLSRPLSPCVGVAEPCRPRLVASEGGGRVTGSQSGEFVKLRRGGQSPMMPSR